MTLKELNDIMRNHPGAFIEPKDFMDAGIPENIVIVLSGLRVLLMFWPKFYEEFLYTGAYFHVQDIFSIAEWEDDCNDADGWCDEPFKGFRIVLFERYFTPMHTKTFPAGYTEKLTYSYVTPENADEVIHWIQCFEFPPQLIDMIRASVNKNPQP